MNLKLLRMGVKEYIAEEKAKSYRLGKGEMALADEETRRQYNGKLNDTIDKLNLSVRAYNALLDNDTRINGILTISTVGDIIAMKGQGLMQVKGLGEKCYNEIVDILVRDYGQNRAEWRWRHYYCRKHK